MRHAYERVYLSDICELQARMFELIREYITGVDEKWYIRRFMKSRCRELLDIGNFVWANKTPDELIDAFLIEIDNKIVKGDSWGGFLPYWVGLMYSFYQWKYNTPSKEIIELLPLEDMERYFAVMHELGDEDAIDRLHAIAVGSKKNKCRR